MKAFYPKHVCPDGLTVSIQASQGHYCSPRSDEGPYTHVELGFPNQRPNAAIMEYAEEPDNPTGTVYGYVPVELVEAWLKEHGGVFLINGLPYKEAL